MATHRMNNRFGVAPSSVNMSRSTFDMPYRHLSTGNFGKLIPFYVNEILPGDTFDVSTRMFSRMSTPRYPVMDDAYIDYFYFFVPSRLVWSRWAEFLGENKYGSWEQPTDYIIPHRTIVSEPGSVLDHMGIPTYSTDAKAQEAGLLARPGLDVQVLPFRAYNLIWNEWFRNENTTDPVLVNTGDDVTDQEVESFQTLRSASKPFDAFTAALPSPQKGDSVDIPLVGNAPVVTGDVHVSNGDQSALRWVNESPNGWPGFGSQEFDSFAIYPIIRPENGIDGPAINFAGVGSYPNGDLEQNTSISPANLWADLSRVSSTTINQLRQAFQMQRLLELQARTGSRYTEIIRASFGVVSPDARLQRPEYLGGSKVRIQMQQVAQTSASNEESPLGKVGAYSKTISANRDFSHSFTEHGFLIGVCVARHALTYQQGLHRMWSRRGRFSLYWPTFAHIGEQPVYRKELYATGQGSDVSNPDLNQDAVFGYEEAWFEYRTKPNEVTGAFRSTVDSNLDEWHYADYYTSTPFLSDGWMEANGVSVDRTLDVTSELHDQLLFDFRVDAKATRVMPLYSIPGLIDHF